MSMDLDAMDRQRQRWRAALLELHLHDADDPAFATGGLGARVETLSVRFVLLPRDPQAFLLEFNDELSSSLRDPVVDPVTGHPSRWGSTVAATAEAAASAEPLGDDDWARYFAIARHRGMDVGLGYEAVWRDADRPKEGPVNGPDEFRLITITGRLWSALHFLTKLNGAAAPELPWQLTVALKQTKEAVLGGFGEGWAEPRHRLPWGVTKCTTSNVLLQREVFDLSDNWEHDLALSVGAQVENAFGSTKRRYLAHTGHRSGEFDSSKYRWD